MTTLSVQFERNEYRALMAKAARQLRTPENLARYIILQQMGFIIDETPVPTNSESDATRQGQRATFATA